MDPSTSFPHAELKPVVGKPSFHDVQQLKKQLISNAVSVASNRGNGALGHAVIVLGQAGYNAIAGPGNNWINPANPGNAPVIPVGATQAQILNAQHQWEREKTEWELFNSTTSALKRQLLAAVDNTYISSLEDPLFGYTNTSVHAILTHLETTYAVVDQDALKTNLDILSAPWEPSESMEPLWQRGVLARQVANTGRVPITDAQLLLIFCDILKSSGLFSLDLRDWDKLPAAQRTLANFQTTFTEANKERIKNLTSGQQFNPHGVPAHAFAATPPNNAITGPSILATPSGTRLSYCWTHGVTNNPEHNSRSCTRKAIGHQETATIDNMLGGNNTIRRKPKEKNIFLDKNPRTPRGSANQASTKGSPDSTSLTENQAPPK